MAGGRSAAAAAADTGEQGDAPETPTPAAQLRLPRMGRYKIPTVRFAFGGALVMSLTSEDDVKVAEALSLGSEGTIELAVKGREAPLRLGFKVVNEGGKFVKTDGDDKVQGTRRIVIGDPTVADDDADD